MIEEFITASDPPRQLQQRLHLHVFFAWMEKRGHILRSPLSSVITHRRRPKLIFRPYQVVVLLRRSADTDMIGYWVLSLFSGLRPSEIQRLRRLRDPWALFTSPDGWARIPARVTGREERQIRISRQLAVWLPWLLNRKVPPVPRNWAVRVPAEIRRIFAWYPDRPNAGRAESLRYAICVPQNTWIAYRLAKGEAPQLIAGDAGYTVNNIKARSTAGITSRRVSTFFAITPDSLQIRHQT